MDMAKEMGFTFPATREQRIAGKISFLTKAHEAHLRFSTDPKYTRKQREWQAELARQADAAIKKLKAL